MNSGLVQQDKMQGYVTYEAFQSLINKIEVVNGKVQEYLLGFPNDNESNSSPAWGEVQSISANTDGSFFIRWRCGEPQGRRLKYKLKINGGEYFHVFPWYNGQYHTLFVDGGKTVVGNNVCSIIAQNGDYSATSPQFTVVIPEKYVNEAPKVSQDIPAFEVMQNQVFSIIYTATDNKEIIKHEFFNGSRMIDYTSRVLKKDDTYEIKTSFQEVEVINEAYIQVTDNEGGKGISNKFKITVK